MALANKPDEMFYSFTEKQSHIKLNTKSVIQANSLAQSGSCWCIYVHSPTKYWSLIGIMINLSCG